MYHGAYKIDYALTYRFWRDVAITTQEALAAGLHEIKPDAIVHQLQYACMHTKTSFAAIFKPIHPRTTGYRWGAQTKQVYI